jgi:hypothetical protein
MSEGLRKVIAYFVGKAEKKNQILKREENGKTMMLPCSFTCMLLFL